jgi:hemerythrin-like domain-containing protein
MSDSKSMAIATIRAEHRALAAVINNMKGVLAEVKAGRMRLDFPLFWSMIHYIDAFPDRLHHPKEDDWLFCRLRQRTHEADALIDELQRQHRNEPLALNDLRRWLGNLEAGVAGSLEGLGQAVTDYAEFTWKHLKSEEHELLPLAQTHLTPIDWNEIAQAFGQNGDPLVGVGDDAALGALFHEIVRRTPAPLGLGPRQSS